MITRVRGRKRGSASRLPTAYRPRDLSRRRLGEGGSGNRSTGAYRIGLATCRAVGLAKAEARQRSTGVFRTTDT